MLEEKQTIIFGDLTCDYVAGLRSLVAIKANPLLIAFFERVTFDLRAEIGKLSFHERTGFPSFVTIQELLAGVQKSPHVPPPLELALVCTYQLACFVEHFTAPGIMYPSPQDTWVVGLCTGLLSAAAVSCCTTITDLIPLAGHTVLLAFRTGLCIQEVRDKIEPQPDGDPAASWATMIPAFESDAARLALQRYNDDKGLPTTSTIYISSYTNTGLTVSGPPASLADLGAYIPGKRSFKLPINAPYHAPGLYKEGDIDRIVLSTYQCEFHSYYFLPHFIDLRG